KILRDVGEAYGYDTVRFFMLSAHYRSPLNYSNDLMEAAQNGLNRIKNCKDNLEFALSHAKGEILTREEQELLKELNMFEEKFHKAMEDDFNTADAISFIFELVKFANTYAKEGATHAFAEAVYNEFMKLNNILGLLFETEANKEHGLSDEAIQQYIEDRKAAKKARDFAEADRIRDWLKDQGILIEDTREGVRFKRI
ncbi:MAG: DALR domain-containing protein, partial [Niameybacter sp.]